MTLSEKIQIIGIFFSTVTASIAIVISVLTLRQNTKMIEASSRPYIGIYLASVYVSNISIYLVIKNFGQSSAHIKSFSYDYDLSQCNQHSFPNREPFQNIENSTLMPGQSFRCVIDLNKVISATDQINFHIVYFSETQHQYEEDICVSLISNLGNFTVHSTNQGKESKLISETLQEMLIHSL